jgi:hypothetical protein
MRLGITGHQRLAQPDDWLWVQDELDKFLLQAPAPLIGFTSLAMGADQRFAEAVLSHGGSFTAIIPFVGYELKFAEGEDREAYQRFLALAADVEVLKAPASNREAYFKAGKQVVNRSELLLAVWDGKPAAGLGGTGNVVAYARQCGRPVRHINPANRAVTEIGYV